MIIGICEDETAYRELEKEYIERFVKKYQRNDEIYTYASAAELLLNLDRDFDILFLDIEMAGMNGMELATKIREVNQRVFLVFVTAHIQYAPDGYEVSAFRYLLKPVSEEKMEETLFSVERNLMRKQEPVLRLKENGIELLMKADDILYIESWHNSVIYHMKGRNIRKRGTLKEVLEKLDTRFVQVHRCYIINLEYIQRRENYELLMINGVRIPVSKYRMQRFKEKYISYWQRFIE